MQTEGLNPQLVSDLLPPHRTTITSIDRSSQSQPFSSSPATEWAHETSIAFSNTHFGTARAGAVPSQSLRPRQTHDSDSGPLLFRRNLGHYRRPLPGPLRMSRRSEEHTSELQSPCN